MKNIAGDTGWCENSRESADMSVRMATVSAPVWRCTCISEHIFRILMWTVYLDHPKPVFGHIECIDEIKTEGR